MRGGSTAAGCLFLLMARRGDLVKKCRPASRGGHRPCPGRGSNRICGLFSQWLIYTGQRIVVTITVLAASVVLVLLASRLLLVANHFVRVGFWCVKSCAGIVVVGSQYFPSLTRYP